MNFRTVKLYGFILAASALVVSGTSMECNVDLQEATPHSAPYIVQIFKISNMADRICDGAIIKSKWILTAAHCVVEVAIYHELWLVAGQHDSRANKTGEQERLVDMVIIHPGYSSCNERDTDCVPPKNDIALLYITQSFVFVMFVQPILLPEFQEIHNGTAQLFGWGIAYNETQSSLLQTRDLQLLNLEKCQESHTTLVDSTNLCTEPLDGNLPFSAGDTGDPLIQLDANNQSILIGLASWGDEVCEPNAIHVFVRVSAFTNWIHTTAF